MELLKILLGMLAPMIKKWSAPCLAVVLLMGAGGYVYASMKFATKTDVQHTSDELSAQITAIGEVLSARMDLSDASSRARDLRAQARVKEKEISDLHMIVNEMDNANTEAGTLLKNRIFSARQELDDINQELRKADAEEADAKRKFQQMSR